MITRTVPISYAGVCAVALTCCVPVEQIEIPDNVQWLAYLAAHETSFDDSVRVGRLLPVEERLFAHRPGTDGWIVGFTTEDLSAAGMPVDSLRDANVRFKSACDFALPSPSWVQTFGGVSDLPTLTSDALGVDALCRTPTAESFMISSIELPDTSELRTMSFGVTDGGEPLFSLSDGRVLRIVDGRLESEGTVSDWLYSLTKVGETYFASAYRGLMSGRTLENLSVFATDPTLFYGHFVPLTDARAVYVESDGRRIAVIDANETGIDANVQFLQTEGGGSFRVVDQRVSVDEQGQVVAAGSDWSWRWNGTRFEHDLGIKKPFAFLESTPVFGDEIGALHTPVSSSPLESRVIANVTTVRSTQYFVPIKDIASYGGGAIVADQLGYLSWIDLSGTVVSIAHLINIPLRLYIVGDDIVVISQHVDSQIFYSGQDTNLTVHVLRRID